jgi:teichuronic acid biosynthesis glycosyltransferase TuaH
MKKIIYIMNVDWNWIKQRPHFLAEGLSEGNDVTVLYQFRYGRKGFQKRGSGKVNVKPIYVIPRGDRNKFFYQVNQFIKSIVIKSQINKINADCVCVTYPDQVNMLPKRYHGQLIYDCMDNHAAFIKDPNKRIALEKQEKLLINKATTILCSSVKLINIFTQRYGENVKKKISLVRNGYNGEILDATNEYFEKSESFTISYFGTISEWFNFDFIIRSLSDFPGLTYLLMGPIAGVSIPEHNRIKYIGTVEHGDLYSVNNNVDCLIMPFVVNEIIEAVDPVKLYEYINFNKNIISVSYEEILRFEPFVHFYTDYESYKQQISTVMKKKDIKYTEKQRTEFLKNNNWDSRVNLIKGFL